MSNYDLNKLPSASFIYTVPIKNYPLNTHEQRLEAVQKEGLIIRKIHKKYLTPEICMAAVKQNGEAIGILEDKDLHIPEDQHICTPELRMTAVLQNVVSLEFMDNHTPELGLAAVTKDGLALRFLEQTEEICDAVLLPAVIQNGLALKFARFQPHSVCLAAVRQNGVALEFVKEQTPSVCTAAVKQNGLALQFARVKPQSVCLAAVKQNGLALKFVGKEQQTDTICLLAVRQNADAFKYVDNIFHTQEVCMEVLKISNKYIRYMADDALEKLNIEYNTSKKTSNIIRCTANGVNNYFKTTKSVDEYIMDKYPNIVSVEELTGVESGVYMVENNNIFTVYKVETVKEIQKGWIYNSESDKIVVNKMDEYELVIISQKN